MLIPVKHATPPRAIGVSGPQSATARALAQEPPVGSCLQRSGRTRPFAQMNAGPVARFAKSLMRDSFRLRYPIPRRRVRNLQAFHAGSTLPPRRTKAANRTNSHAGSLLMTAARLSASSAPGTAMTAKRSGRVPPREGSQTFSASADPGSQGCPGPDCRRSPPIYLDPRPPLPRFFWTPIPPLRPPPLCDLFFPISSCEFPPLDEKFAVVQPRNEGPDMRASLPQAVIASPRSDHRPVEVRSFSPERPFSCRELVSRAVVRAPGVACRGGPGAGLCARKT